MICAGWNAYYLVRVKSGWLDLAIEPDLFVPMVFVYLYWVVVFFMVGLYRSWYASSRFDELTLLFKTVTLGCLFLFFAVFVDDQGHNVAVSSRLLIAIYWSIILSFTAIGRMAVRSFQRRLLIAGVGVHPTVIVGSADTSRSLYDDLAQYPALGYKVVGFAGLDGRRPSQPYRNVPVLGTVGQLHSIIQQHGIKDVLIALDSSDHDRMVDVISRCNSSTVSIKIIPDLYDIISGQARTNQIYGFPLIEVMPQLLTPWEATMKRTFDIVLASTVLLLGLPVWILVAITIRLESPGPIFYKQERVGKDGEIFNIVKFRSMRRDAEKGGPQWAGKKDPRVTRIGRFIRKTHLDEIPQVFNVLRGDMSIVGPRPERPVFVEQLKKEIPMYPRRLIVRPGVTGWAQVKHKYDESVEDVRKKVQYDLFYIENISLRMDFKILLSTVYHTLMGRGR